MCVRTFITVLNSELHAYVITRRIGTVCSSQNKKLSDDHERVELRYMDDGCPVFDLSAIALCN